MTSFVLILAFVGTCVSSQNNTVDVKASTDGRDVRVEAKWTHDFGKGLSSSVGGHVDSSGNSGASVGVKWRFGRRRRSAEQIQFFTLSLDVNKCNFNLYDANRDDLLTKEELVAVFGENTNTADLFEALDMLSGESICSRIVYTIRLRVITCTLLYFDNLNYVKDCTAVSTRLNNGSWVDDLTNMNNYNLTHTCTS
ncbi:hypothetical protein DPMN_013157 [Dreissena polymorpha]|uniref:EF-hand domain-containing protein n=1 Tax=Dreissena polymorpha TaxID=45954 RepID=A0A9D4S3I5_DREPO|nr:hypothetical protein DPMN_013157 [Dreissena polymorpha]